VVVTVHRETTEKQATVYGARETALARNVVGCSEDMNMTSVVTIVRSCAAIGLNVFLLGSLAHCGPQPSAAAPAPAAAAPKPYQPNFSYKPTSTSATKLDVTIGVVLPSTPASATAAATYLKANQNDEVVKGMLSAMGASFAEILIAKGFNTKGPFMSLNEMTFPEKKGSDLLLYPEFDFEVTLQTTNLQKAAPPPAASAAKPESKNTTNVMDLFGGGEKKPEPAPAAPAAAGRTGDTCDLVLTVTGNVLFVAQEPLSSERMWIKRLDVSAAKQTFNGQVGAPCGGAQGEWSLEVHDAWAKAHEVVYQSAMKSLDNYVNGEEFQGLKKQSDELRQKKTY
jgi:hypothetical protein